MSLKDDPQVKEHLIGFPTAEETTGESLPDLILKRLEELQITFDDYRGHYENGPNMRGNNKEVQARLLQLNPRSYFGIVQKLYSLFSASPQWWAILKKHVNLSLKI